MRRVSDVNRDVLSTHDWGLIGCNDSFSGECIRIIGDNFDRRGNGGVVVNHIDIEPILTIIYCLKTATYRSFVT